MNGNTEDLLFACFSSLICTDVKIPLYLIGDRMDSMQIAGLLLVGAVFFNDLCMLRLYVLYFAYYFYLLCNIHLLLSMYAPV